MKYLTLVFLFLCANFAFAGEPEAVSIGGGKYMMTDHHISIFGSKDGLVVELIKRAHVFCKSKTGAEAELLSTDGSDAVPGEMQYGRLSRPAQGATATIYFTCPKAVGSESPTAGA